MVLYRNKPLSSHPIVVIALHFSLILGIILAVETALEFRHYRLGYATPFFGQLPSADSAETAAAENPDTNENMSTQFGPTDEFPFRSEIIQAQRGNEVRVWIASASHAQGGRHPADAIFPNLICLPENLATPCEVINGSKGGMTVKENIEQIEEFSHLYKPDYAILYQMSMIISQQQKQLTQKNTEGPKAKPKKTLVNISPLKTYLQTFSLYVHLSDFIGGNIKLQGALKSNMPDTMVQDFERQIYAFIATCREHNIKPMLATFAASHDVSNIGLMPASERTNFVKYNTYLSPEGWMNTIALYNEKITAIANEEEIPLVDIAQQANGKTQLFDDYVHFNRKGHKTVAITIAQTLSEVFQQGIHRNGI